MHSCLHKLDTLLKLKFHSKRRQKKKENKYVELDLFPAIYVDANCRLPWIHDRSLFTHYFERIIHFLAIGRYLQKNPKWFIAWHQFFFDAIFHPNHFWVKKNYTVLHTKISRSMGHLNPPWPNRFSLLCKATFFQHTNLPSLIIWSVDNICIIFFLQKPNLFLVGHSCFFTS